MFKKNEIQSLNQLQRQKDQVQKELSLEQQQAQIVKNYKMKEGNYKVILTIYQLNDLQPKSLKLWNFQIDQKTACDAFVQVNVNGQTKRTEIKKQTNNPIFDEQMYFQFDQMTVDQLDRSKIQFNVYDTKLWGASSSLIGTFELDWTNVYFRRNHQIYRAWLTLYDPTHQFQGPVGYLLVNIAILGQNDQITVHDSAFIKDPVIFMLVTMEDTITSPKLPLIDFAITIEIYRAQSLVPLDFMSKDVRAYVIAKFSGNKIKTSSVKSLNPQWNQCLKIGTQVPNKSKYITLEIRNKNLFRTDDLIGILKIPFIDLCTQQQPKPVWGQLYGPPMSGKDIQPYNYASKMQVYGDKIGSHYRGRLLYKISGHKDVYTKNIKNKMVFKFPYRTVPVIPLKLFTLRIDLIEGFGLPEIKQCYIHICMGEYTIKSQLHKMKNDVCEFFQELKEKKLNLPESISSMPDLTIYFANGLNEENRLAYVRIKAASIIARNNQKEQARIYKLTVDKSLDKEQDRKTGGYITAKISLFSSHTHPPPRNEKALDKMKHKQQFVLKVFLYRGQNLPPANQQGDCDPQINFSFNGSKFTSKLLNGTYNPIWNEVHTMDVKVQNLFDVDLQKCLICDVVDNQGKKKSNYIGSFSLKLNGSMRNKFVLPINKGQKKEKIDMIYSKPRWYYVINPNIQVGNNMFGRVLLSCAIFKKQYSLQETKKKLSFEQIQKMCSKQLTQIDTPSEQKNVYLYLIGLRQMHAYKSRNIISKMINSGQQEKKEISNIQIIPQIKINNEQLKGKKIFNTNDSNMKQQSYLLRNNGCEINDIYSAKIKVPKNKRLSTFMQVKVKNAQNQLLYGYNSVNLNEWPNFDEPTAKQAKSQEEKLQILDVDRLIKKLNKLKLLNKIKEETKQHDQNAKFIAAKRLQVANAKQLMPPNQVENDFHTKKEGYGPDQDPQMMVQMQKMLRQFQQNLQTGNQQQLLYLKKMLNEGSNNIYGNNPLNKKNQPNNIIDQQSIQLNLYEYDERSSRMKKITSNQHEHNNQSESQDVSLLDQNSNNSPLRKRNMKKEQLQSDQINKLNKQLMPVINETTAQTGNNSKRIKGFKGFKSRTDITSKQKEQLSKTQLRRKTREFIEQEKSSAKDVKNFDLHQTLTLSDRGYNQRAINYSKVQKGLSIQKQHEQQAIQKQQQYKYAAAVKLSLFKWMRKQNHQSDKQTYQDYDTDQQEDLDIIPQWYKGRKILMNDLQTYFSDNRTIEKVNIYRGRQIENLETRVKEKIGCIKMVLVSGDDQTEIQARSKYYQKLLRPKQFCCRIYVLKGKSLITTHQKKPTTYLRFSYGQKVTIYKQNTIKDQNNPQYYMCHQEWITLPGPSTIKVQVMQKSYFIGSIGDKLSKDKVLGYTEIDVEDRYFMKKWHLIDKKPIQLRNLYSKYGVGSQGRLQTWVDLVQKKKWLVTPAIKIVPPPWDQYELRVIVWSTKDCVYKNQQMQSNDVFVRGQIGGGLFQQTDVHWSCRAVGNFNYRFKFPVFYPPKPEDMYSDIFIVQIWDKDVIGYNNLIGQTRINLNQMHKIIQKAVKRKQPVAASKKIVQKNLALTDKFWFDVYNHREKDQFGQLQSQGKVQLSFELVPMEMAKNQRANGYGRAQPNVYPSLPEPVGRLNFNFLRPLDFLKQILGPSLYKQLCIKCFCLLILVIIVLLFVFFGTSIVAGVVASD